MIGLVAATSTASPPPTGWYYEIGRPFDWALTHIAQALGGFPPSHAIGAFGLAVVAVTLIIRTALFPVFQWQLRAARRVQAEQRIIAPALSELRKKYRKEPQKLNAEMQKLYKEHGISPFSSLSGCLPALVQLPILAGLYSGIRTAAQFIHPSERSFLWIGDVSKSGLDACCAAAGKTPGLSGIATHPAVLLLPVIAAAATFVQSRMMMPPTRPDMSDQERQMQGVSKNMSLLFPVFIFALALGWPYGIAQGVAIYWATQSLYMIIQQYYVIGWGGMRVPAWLPGAGRVTALSHPRGPLTPAPAVAKALAAPKGGPSSGTARDGASGRPARGRDGRASRPAEDGEANVATSGANGRTAAPGATRAGGSGTGGSGTGGSGTGAGGNGARPPGRQPARRPNSQAANRRRRRR